LVAEPTQKGAYSESGPGGGLGTVGGAYGAIGLSTETRPRCMMDDVASSEPLSAI